MGSLGWSGVVLYLDARRMNQGGGRVINEVPEAAASTTKAGSYGVLGEGESTDRRYAIASPHVPPIRSIAVEI